MAASRVYGLAQGYEDLNDHDTLRHDLAWQTAVERDVPLASSPTLCRWENRADRSVAWAIQEVLVEQFIASCAKAPTELILDFDATDDRVHGQQEGRFFHGYYGDYCFLPLYVFCGQQLLVAFLRPSNIDPARHAWAILKLLIRRLRAARAQVKIILRGDSGFCRWRLPRGCEDHPVGYVVGLAKNTRVLALAQELIDQAAADCQTHRRKQRLLGEVGYAAGTWDRPRRVVVKAEPTRQGSNPRFVVTNLKSDPQQQYDTVSCARGEMENRIKEQQLGLFADRTSCHGWWANPFRLLLSSCAYVLMERMRALALRGTGLTRAQVRTIRLKLLKIGAVVLRNIRRARLLLSSSYPYQAVFAQAAKALESGCSPDECCPRHVAKQRGQGACVHSLKNHPFSPSNPSFPAVSPRQSFNQCPDEIFGSDRTAKRMSKTLNAWKPLTPSLSPPEGERVADRPGEGFALPTLILRTVIVKQGRTTLEQSARAWVSLQTPGGRWVRAVP